MANTSLTELAKEIKERLLRCKCMAFRIYTRNSFDRILKYISKQEEKLIFYKLMENLENYQNRYGSFEVNKQFASQINDLFPKRDKLKKQEDERLVKKNLTKTADFLHVLGRLSNCDKEIADFVDEAFDEVSLGAGTGYDGKNVLTLSFRADGASATSMDRCADTLAKLLGNAVPHGGVYGSGSIDVYPQS